MFELSPRMPGENNKNYSYRIIREAIMSLQLKPGQAISEIELAEALNISRTPIREVMAKLREEHLVEVIPQVGTYVSKINPQLIEEAAFARITLEREVLKLSCEDFPEQALNELKENVSLQKDLLNREGKEREFHQLDKKFHAIIFKGNHKENVWEAITRLGTHYNRMRLLSEMENTFESAINQHEQIIQIIEHKQKERVEDVILEHIVEPIKLWEELYKEESPFADYFDRNYKMPAF